MRKTDEKHQQKEIAKMLLFGLPLNFSLSERIFNHFDGKARKVQKPLNNGGS
jgi:hypothetical protein